MHRVYIFQIYIFIVIPPQTALSLHLNDIYVTTFTYTEGTAHHSTGSGLACKR
jgi:hypothetical protein